MSEHYTRASGLGYLERAILEPARRPAALKNALQAVVADFPARGSALLWPRADGSGPWQIEYAGERAREMRRWLSLRLDASLDAATMNFAEKSPHLPGAEPLLFRLHPGTASPNGLWVVWSYRDLGPAPGDGEAERFRKALELFVEVEHGERLYFRDRDYPLGPELARALGEGDRQAFPALLALARTVSGADFAYWGGVHDDVLDVEWHVGARDAGFGFELPLGQGVGGRAFAWNEPIEVPDYRNCQYRYPEVSDATDSEEVRSVLAVPVRSATTPAGAVLYPVRRTVDPFSPAQRALVLRLARGIEPSPGPRQVSRHFFASSMESGESARADLRRLLLHSNQVQEVESWLERAVRGPAISVDHGGRPYALGNIERLEHLRASEAQGRGPLVHPLEGSGAGGERGHLYLWPSVELPLAGWPDLLDDAAAVCNIVIDRAEHAHHRLHQQRSQWLGGVREGRTDSRAFREGNRLGLPVESGEVWAISWREEEVRSAGRTRLMMLAEDAVLDQLGSPLIVLEKGIGVLLIKRQVPREPSAVRDELLKVFGPAPLWLVHGATYDSFEGLEEALTQTVRAAERVRQEQDERYVLEVNGWGLDSLLENPKLSGGLATFAESTLAPLAAYDRETGSQLTETLCRVLTSGSLEEAAEHLFVHPNTVRYRVRRAEQLLGRELGAPKEKAALTLAAFVWYRGGRTP